MKVKFFTYSQYHNKKNIGSTKIRVDNLIKYWPEAALYRYGDMADVMIFQKVFITLDYKFIRNYRGIKILDICDPEWRDTPDVFIKETLDEVDTVVTSSDNMTRLLSTMTDTPVVTIKDRFDISILPPPKEHHNDLKVAAWFGYVQNAESLKFAIPSLEARNISLIVVSNEDPCVWRFANDPESYKEKVRFFKYTDEEKVYRRLQQADVMVLPAGIKPFDKYKSNNRSVLSQLLGIPVATDTQELDNLKTAEARNQAIKKVYNELIAEYDCKKSVSEYQNLISQIKSEKMKYVILDRLDP